MIDEPGPVPALRVGSSRLRRIGREAIWIAAGQFTAIVGAAVGVRLLTGYMPPAAYGELALGITVAMLSQQAIFGPMGNAVVRFFAPSEEAAALPVYFAAVRWLYLRVAAVSAVVGAVAYAATNYLAPGFGMLAPIATAYALVLGCSGALDSIQNASRHRAVVAVHQSLGQWFRFICAIAAVRLLSPSGSAAIGGYTIAAIVVVTSQMMFLRRTFRGSLAHRAITGPAISQLTRKMWVYSWPFAVWAPFTWVQLSADRWALQHYASTAQVGLYQAMYQVGYYPMIMASGFLLQLATPILFAHAGDGTQERAVGAARNMNIYILLATLCLTVLAVVAGLVFHERICALLLAPAYRTKSWLLPWFIFSGGMFAAGQVLAMNALVGMKARSLLYPKVGTAIAGGVLTFALTRAAGLYGTTVAGALFSLGYFVWLVCLDRRTLAQEAVRVFTRTASAG